MHVIAIRLPQEKNAEEFVRFMREEYMPAIYDREPTRIGKATFVQLLRGNTTNTRYDFTLLVDGLMTWPRRFVGDEVAEKFESFEPEVEVLAEDFFAVATWPEPGN